MTGLFETIRQSVFKRFVQKKMSKDVQHQLMPVRVAEKIGILFQADEENCRAAIVAYADRLKNEGKEVQLLGYLRKRNRKIQYLFPYITSRDVTWFGKPKGGTIGYFIKYPFDILINFAPKELIPFEYISALSRASCRIGFNEKSILESYDCILLAANANDIEGQIKDIDKYLS